jgi:hypothetical protein
MYFCELLLDFVHCIFFLNVTINMYEHTDYVLFYLWHFVFMLLSANKLIQF